MINDIKSQYTGDITSIASSVKDITSKTEQNIESKTTLDIVSKTDLDIESIAQDVEREAFLLTAKHNAAMMFSKYL